MASLVDKEAYEAYVKAVAAVAAAHDELVEVGQALADGETPPRSAEAAVERLHAANIKFQKVAIFDPTVLGREPPDA